MKFNFSLWENGEEFPGFPLAPDRYQPGHIKWGSDPKRGRAIQARRLKKKWDTNEAFFRAEILPTLELPPDDWHALGNALQDPSLIKRGGWVRYELGDKASWIHPELEPERIARALEIGATPAL